MDQTFEIHFAGDVIQAELDELGPLFDQVPVLGDHVAVTPATNANANHGSPM